MLYDAQGGEEQTASSWKPIPELQVPNADIAVFWLEQHDIGFFTPVKDPWFSAESPVNLSTPIGSRLLYQSEVPAHAVVCTQQYQFCNPSLEKNASCTPPMGIDKAAETAAATIFSKSADRDRFLWSMRALTNGAGFREVVAILKEGALLASDYTSALGQFGLPDNQWELELQHWFKITMADLQRTAVEQATGPSIPEAASFHSPPTTDGERAACHNQKIRSDSYTSFNVLGLILIFSIGGLIMLISACLPALTARMQRKKPFASLEWITNDTLQLQRLAHEAVGAGDWEGTCDDYPRTQRGDLLAVLDITDPKHPKLQLPAKAETVREEERDSVTQVGEEREEQQEERHEEQHASQHDEQGSEGRANDSVRSSLFSVEIPRVSMELSPRFAGQMC